jgi:hypothetical protein
MTILIAPACSVDEYLSSDSLLKQTTNQTRYMFTLITYPVVPGLPLGACFTALLMGTNRKRKKEQNKPHLKNDKK